jgi:molybdopterin-guanine dinucleotide biosynthesis protein A
MGLIEVGGRPIIRTSADVLSRVFSEVWIVTNTPDEHAFLGLPMTKDIHSGCGSLGGLHAGLSICRAPRAFVMGCDMPFPSEAAIRLTATIAPAEYDVVIPRIRGHLEPLHAVYSKRCLGPIEELIQRSDFKIINMLDAVRVYEIPESEFARVDHSLRCAVNVNTPDDVRRARLDAEENRPD